MINKFKKNNSLAYLILTNVVVIFIAIIQKWSLTEIVWIYWFQSVIIGFVNVIRIFNLKNFTVSNLKINGRSVNDKNKGKIFSGIFFAVHYGFFHFVYLMFMIFDGGIPFKYFFYILVTSAIFLINHVYSFVSHKEEEERGKQDLGKIIFFPYARIIPMHLIIIFGFMWNPGIIGVIFFTILKTVADAIMHQVHHKKI